MIYMTMFFLALFTVLVCGAWRGENGIFANMLLLMMGLGLLLLMNPIATIIFIVIIVIIIWLLCYSGSNKSKERDEIKLSNNSIKFKEDLY